MDFTFVGLAAFGFQWLGGGGLEQAQLALDPVSIESAQSQDSLVQDEYLKALTPTASAGFSLAIASSGETLVVGSPGENSPATGIDGFPAETGAFDSGSVQVFVRQGGQWRHQAYIKASNTGIGDNFGISVAIDGDTLVVGASSEDSSATGTDGDQANDNRSDAGAVYVFVRVGEVWSQEAYLKASNTGTGDQFGSSVAIAGDLLAVSSLAEDSAATGIGGDQSDNSAIFAGAVYVFGRAGGTWSQDAYIKASNTQADDQFGYSISLSANTLVVGAPREDSDATGVNGSQGNGSRDSGAAYVFVRGAGGWQQEAYLKPFQTDRDGSFGSSVSYFGERLVVGAKNGLTIGGAGPGAAYVFDRSAAIWTAEELLTSSSSERFDGFGGSVSYAGGAIVIGARGEDSSSIGVNGDPFNNDTLSTGAVYTFVQNNTGWIQQAYIKASNPDRGDLFGYSVSASNDFFAVGAPGESSGNSGSMGIGGDPDNNERASAGAAFVFNLPATLAAAVSRNAGNNPASYVAPLPSLGTLWTPSVDLGGTSQHAFGMLIGYLSPSNQTLNGGQTLLINTADPAGRVFTLGSRPGPLAQWSLVLPTTPSLAGIRLYTQALHFGGVQPFALSNAQDLVIDF